MMTNKIYNPMTKSLTLYFLNPIDLIINYYYYKDFKSNGNQNIFFFLINFIISFIINICGLVFNEIVILFFCHLERDTHHQVSRRSFKSYAKELRDFFSSKDDEFEDELELSTSVKQKIQIKNIKTKLIKLNIFILNLIIIYY